MAVRRAALELINEGVTRELRAHVVAAGRALDAARWAVDYTLAEVGAPC